METTNKFTLEYLTNPLYIKKNQGIVVDSGITKDERSFYRKRIIAITKDMLKGEYISPNLEKIHNDYIKSLIHHFKTTDEFEILQSEYASSLENSKNMDLSGGDLVDASGAKHVGAENTGENKNDINDVMMKHTNKRVSLDTFVMKKPLRAVKETIHIPKKKEINVNTPAHKIKGIKPKTLKE
jgi:hypothetical protein